MLGFFHREKGVFYGGEKMGTFLLWQLLGAAALVTWTATVSVIYFAAAQRLNKLRTDKISEIMGLDYDVDYRRGGFTIKEIRDAIANFYQITSEGSESG